MRNAAVSIMLDIAGPSIGCNVINEPLYDEQCASVSRYGTELYFSSNRPDGTRHRIWRTTRASPTQEWQLPSVMSELAPSSLGDMAAPRLSSDALEMFLAGYTGSDYNIYRATRTLLSAPWSAPVLVPELSSITWDLPGILVANDLVMYFTSQGGSNEFDIYIATRATVTSSWTNVAPVSSLSVPGIVDRHPWVNGDETMALMTSNRDSQQQDIYVATRGTPTTMWNADRDQRDQLG